jgi:hypothetical protein
VQVSSRSLVWYVAYGSNMRMSRFRCYLAGGCPAGGRRTYIGARDPADPLAAAPVAIAGQVMFAGESTVWGGGMAFYDPDAPGSVACRAYLITADQLNDVIAQEIRLPPGTDLGLHAVMNGGQRALGHGRYDSAIHVGVRAGRPMLTITSNTRDLTPTAPAAAYVWSIARGLHEAHGWEPARISSYLTVLPGISGQWTAAEVEALSVQGQPQTQAPRR